jgi:hypothetical protein
MLVLRTGAEPNRDAVMSRSWLALAIQLLQSPSQSLYEITWPIFVSYGAEIRDASAMPEPEKPAIGMSFGYRDTLIWMAGFTRHFVSTERQSVALRWAVYNVTIPSN